MAVTATIEHKIKLSPQSWMTYVKVDMDASYPTGGEAITANQMGLNSLDFVIAANATGGFVARFDEANMKILMYYADYDAVADGALIQVPNETDIATADVYITAVGR